MSSDKPSGLLNIKKAIQDQRQPLYKKLVRYMWRGFGLALIGLFVLFFLISLMDIPSFRDLEDPHSALASEVYAENREVLGRYYIENRVPVNYNDLSPYLVKALLATEDERFHEHCGIDPRAIGRVLVRTLMLQDQSAGGGSTITQQLAKMLYSDRNFENMGTIRKTITLVYKKLREWITAVKLERSYTKEEIIAMYLNQFNFVNNAYGIRAASEIYFGKRQDKLKVEEAAMLIGMLQNPSRYNPLRFPESCIKRRRVVLYQMQQNGYITEAAYDSLKVLPLDLTKFRRETPADDKAPYFCMELRKDLQVILNQPECRKPDGTKYDIYKDGLKIFTSIDPVVQKYAEQSMYENMVKLQARMFQIWKGRDPWAYKITDRDGTGTTDEEIQIRKDALWKLIREGDRYQSLRPQYLGEYVDKISEQYKGFELRDADIQRMMSEEEKPGTLKKLKAKKWISDEMHENYKSIMASSDWKGIKNKYLALQNTIKKVCYTKMPMKVFAYNTKNETDTLMSLLDSIKYSRMFLQSGLMAMDPETGLIKAWVGGIDYKHFQYDHIKIDRQVGSTFKPIVYATAISQQGISPCYQVYDQAVTIPALYQNFKNEKDWTPKDAKGFYSGRLMTLKEALKLSVNSISAYLMKQMGDTEPVRGLAHNMGIDSTLKRSNGEYRLPRQPSICLGAADLSVYEMTAAYATFANNGVYTTPSSILRIEDKNGRIIYRSQQYERTVLQPEANYAMVEMLKNVTKGASGFSSLKSEIGGKTGTTNDYSDGWFMGITPSLVVGTWVGGEDRWVRFLTLDDGQGAKMARPIFVSLLSKLEKDPNSGYNSAKTFKKPPGDMAIELDCRAYNRTNNTASESFQEDEFNDEIDDIPAADADTSGKAPGGKPVAPPPAKKPASETFGDELDN